MSLVGNWQREAERFAPRLAVHVPHGAAREVGSAFTTAAHQADLVLTTYSLLARDRHLLAQVSWGRLALDEAQNVKNPWAQAAPGPAGTDVPFLHGGVPKRGRDQMVAAFQSDGGPPLLVLSLKAGGVGLNLTAANHVIHFDRWWNPALEDQATDRAFRIASGANVQVRNFACVGTVEERIDRMIERGLAQWTIGAGEAWIRDSPSPSSGDSWPPRTPWRKPEPGRRPLVYATYVAYVYIWRERR